MAKAVINLQKESGGIVKISPVDGIGITEVTVPESGELATVDYVKNNGDTNAITSFSQISGTNEISGIELTNNIHDVFGDGSAVATYTLDGNANDLGGNYNGVPSNISYSDGKFGKAAVFSSTTGQKIGHSISLGANFSISLWVYKTVGNGTYYSGSTGDIISFGSDNGQGICIVNYTGGKFCLWRGSTIGGSAVSTNPDIGFNSWNHLVVTYSNGNLTKFYVNGTPSGEYLHSTTTTNTGIGPWSYIGDTDHSAKHHKSSMLGSIDQIRIFNRALTEAEINTLYTETRVSADAQLNVNQGTFIYPKGLGARGYIKSSDVFTGTIDVSAQTDGWKYVAKDENNNFSFYTDKPTIGKKSSTLYLENGRLHKTVDDTTITPISFLSNKVRIASGIVVELAPSDISKTISESLEAGSYFGKNAIVAYATIDMTTTPPTILDSYNIASVIRSSNGVGKITLINAVDKNTVTAICGSNSVAGTITATTKNEVSFATGATNYAKTSVIVIGGKF